MFNTLCARVERQKGFVLMFISNSFFRKENMYNQRYERRSLLPLLTCHDEEARIKRERTELTEKERMQQEIDYLKEALQGARKQLAISELKLRKVEEEAAADIEALKRLVDETETELYMEMNAREDAERQFANLIKKRITNKSYDNSDTSA